MMKTILAILAVMMISALGAPDALSLSHDIRISLFPPDRSLRAADVIHIPRESVEDGQVRFLINRALTVENIRADAGVERWYTQEEVDPAVFKALPDSGDRELIARSKGVFVTFSELPPSGDSVSVEIEYTGVLYDSLEPPDESYAKGFETTTGLIEERGIFLTNESLWYPFQFGGMFTFVIRADVPYGWMTVSQGDLEDEWVDSVDLEERVFTIWKEPNPTPEMYLVAGEYYRHEEYHNGTWVMTYTYDESDSLARVYMDATKRYIAMYEHLIGDYPFGKFAMVENFWQTGYGMPSFTFLGSKVIRLPFIVRTSYGHEILHNWWGNSVYVDYDGGNWCEGLTTYGADYLYKEQISADEARDYRHHTLIAFNNYVTEASDFPLSEFHERHNAASQSIGYGKSLMVYHMLRKSLGDSLFWEVLREFYRRSKFAIASWSDVEAAFSDVSGQDLHWFFDQWTSRTGLPAIGLTDASYSTDEGDYVTTFRLTQDPPAFVVDLPVVIETAGDTISTAVRLRGADSTYALRTKTKPVCISIDPDYDTFRKLYREEIPVTLGGMFAQDSVTVVIGSDVDDTALPVYRAVAETWGLGDRTVREADCDPGAVRQEHLWLLGSGEILRDIVSREERIETDQRAVMISGNEFPLEGGTVISTFRNPDDEDLSVGLVLGRDVESLRSLAPRIPHYSKYSYLAFAGGRPVLRGVWKVERSPLRADLTVR